MITIVMLLDTLLAKISVANLTNNTKQITWMNLTIIKLVFLHVVINFFDKLAWQLHIFIFNVDFALGQLLNKPLMNVLIQRQNFQKIKIFGDSFAKRTLDSLVSVVQIQTRSAETVSTMHQNSGRSERQIKGDFAKLAIIFIENFLTEKLCLLTLLTSERLVLVQEIPGRVFVESHFLFHY